MSTCSLCKMHAVSVYVVCRADDVRPGMVRFLLRGGDWSPAFVLQQFVYGIKNNFLQLEIDGTCDCRGQCLVEVCICASSLLERGGFSYQSEKFDVFRN